MKNKIKYAPLLATLLLCHGINTGADTLHKVVAGDTMWKIAVKYEAGLSEIISANRNISDPALIYPGQIITVPTVNDDILSFEKEVIRLVNIERKKHGISPLTEDWELCRVARIKSADMKTNNYFSHTSPTYGSPFDMMRSFGIKYKSAAENIAKGQKTPDAVVKSWMNSSGHRKNILNEKYTHIGVGYEKKGNIWTQMFIRK